MPLNLLLNKYNATISLCHRKTKLEDMKERISEAEILISCCGDPEFIKPHWIKEGAIVIDVGISQVTDSQNQSVILGDVCFEEETLQRVKHITPVPGGVGPMTITMLMNNLTVSWMRTNFDLMINEQSYRSL